jgi:hypothetical protein
MRLRLRAPPVSPTSWHFKPERDIQVGRDGMTPLDQAICSIPNSDRVLRRPSPLTTPFSCGTLTCATSGRDTPPAYVRSCLGHDVVRTR